MNNNSYINRLQKTNNAAVIMILTILTLLAQNKIFGQGINRPTIDRYEGLTSSTSWGQNPMIKDHLGRYWVVTMDGLNIYDGYSINPSRVEQEDAHSIVNNSLTTIAKSPDGNIWIGTANDGVFYYDIRQEKFKKLDLSKFKGDNDEILQVNGMDIDKEGNVLIVPPFKGVYKVSLRDSTVHKVEFNTQKDLIVNNHYGVMVLDNGNICVQAENGLYIGTLSGDFEYFEYPTGFHQADKFRKLKNGNIVIANLFDKGLYLFDINSKKYHLIDSEIIPTGISESIESYIYVGDSKGVHKIDFQNDSLQLMTREVSHIKDGVRDVKGNLIAMGSQKELLRIGLKNNKLQLINLKSTGVIKSLNNRTIYYGSGSMFYTYDIPSGKEKLITDLKGHGDYIETFHIAEDGSFYINLFVIKTKKYKVIHINQDGKVKKVMKNIGAFYFMKNVDNKISVNTAINHSRKEEFELSYAGDIVSKIEKKPYNFFNIKNLMLRKNNELWIARFNNGIDIVSPSRDSVYLLQPKDPKALYYGSNVKMLFEANNGNIYIQTEIGVNEYDPTQQKSLLINHKTGQMIMTFYGLEKIKVEIYG